MTVGSIGLFDLNIEEVLEHWEVEHALREMIANALDEQLLTGTRDVDIYQDAEGTWHIRDFGRGLAIEHFTLNENPEKLEGPAGVIGKFGVGLKDALATLHRRGVAVAITSRYGHFTLREAHKHGFDAISTLHVVHETSDTTFVGTDIALPYVTTDQVDTAKDLFLRFAGDRMIEETSYGQVLEKGSASPRVYISGVLAAEESNFLFSYNITSLTNAMRRRLNRERLNVGRTTYAERVKAILKIAESDEVCDALAGQVSARARGDQCDELQWIEISQRALTLLHRREDVAFVTEEEIALLPNVLDNMRSDGLNVVLVTGAQKEKLDLQLQTGDTDLRTVEGYIEQYNESFSYKFVGREELTSVECSVFDHADEVVGLMGTNGRCPPVQISETMRVGLDDTAGVWDHELGVIIIKRSELASLSTFAGTLLHELAHARTGAVDATRFFESVLTEYLGTLATCAIAPSATGGAPGRTI